MVPRCSIFGQILLMRQQHVQKSIPTWWWQALAERRQGSLGYLSPFPFSVWVGTGWMLFGETHIKNSDLCLLRVLELTKALILSVTQLGWGKELRFNFKVYTFNNPALPMSSKALVPLKLELTDVHQTNQQILFGFDLKRRNWSPFSSPVTHSPYMH